MPVDATLLTFTKSLMGFYGTGDDALVSPLILSAEQYLHSSGVAKPVLTESPTSVQTAEHELALSLYNTAAGIQTKILHDGDPKGDLDAILTRIIVQIAVIGGGE